VCVCVCVCRSGCVYDTHTSHWSRSADRFTQEPEQELYIYKYKYMSKKFSFDHRNKLHFTVYSHREQMIYSIIIFHCFTVFMIK